MFAGCMTGTQRHDDSHKRGRSRTHRRMDREHSVMSTEKSPEALLSCRQPEGQGRALRGTVIAGIPQT